MLLTKELLLGITLTTLCSPIVATTLDGQVNKKQQREFLSFLAFIGNVEAMESAGIDVDQLLTDPTKQTPESPVLPIEAGKVDE